MHISKMGSGSGAGRRLEGIWVEHASLMEGGSMMGQNVARTSTWLFCFILERAAERRLARMRRARLGSMPGSRRGSAAGWRPPLPLRLCAGVRYARCTASASASAHPSPLPDSPAARLHVQS